MPVSPLTIDNHGFVALMRIYSAASAASVQSLQAGSSDRLECTAAAAAPSPRMSLAAAPLTNKGGVRVKGWLLQQEPTSPRVGAWCREQCGDNPMLIGILDA